MADPAHLKILSAGAMKYVVLGLAPRFERAAGVRLDLVFGTIGTVRQRLRDGATPDVIIGTSPAIEQIERDGVLLPGSRAEIGRTATGLGVRAGTQPPDISSAERLREALLAARSIAFTNPTAGGTSGLYLVGLLARLGIAEAVARKALLCRDGDEVVDKVVSGDAEIGSTFISEFITREGMTVVGPLPGPVAHGASYAAGLAAAGGNRDAARRFIRLLTDPAQRDYLASRGFEAVR